ncbi:TPA: hypothetical protein ACR3QW_003337 [Legionella pneumophila]|jgi:hypothetical protein
MARGYRAIVELDGKESALQTADRIFHEWAHNKYPLEGRSARIECEEEGIYRFGELTSWKGSVADIVATKLTETSEDKHYERQLLEMVERTGDGHQQWTTRIFAMHATKESNYRDVVWIEVTPPRDFEGDAKPPRLVRDLISEGHCNDRGMPLSESLQSISDDRQVEELIGWIRDERRRASVVVAAPLTDGSGEGDLVAKCRWKEILGSLTKDSLGCASYFLLTPDAYRQFRERIGEECVMPRGSLRTYLPGFRPDDPTDRFRHRVLSAATLLRGYDEKNKRFRPELSAIIARTPCEYLWEKGLDKELRRAQAPLDKKRLTVPTFYPLRKATESAELLDERVRQRVAESLSVLSHEAVLPVEESSKPELVKPEGAAPGAHVSDGSGSAVVAEPAPQRSESPHLAWYEPLRRLIRRFLPSFSPRTPADLTSGVMALSSGLDSMNRTYEELSSERDKLSGELQAAKELLDGAADDSEEIRTLKEDYDNLDRELSEAQEERENLARRNQYLEWKVKNPGATDVERDFVEEQLDARPTCMSEFFDRMTLGSFDTVTNYVVLSDPDGMMEDILKLDALASSRYAAEFWNYVLVLRDYMRAREAGDFAGGNVHDYLANPPEGYRTCSAARHKSNESETVKGNEKMRRERTRPVPREVDPSGEIEMWAHFAPTHCDQNAPRMYYYADTKTTGKVYIGYIGRHLTNTRTN